MDIGGVALVCGAGSGIGKAVALQFSSCRVSFLVCADLMIEKARETVQFAKEFRKEDVAFRDIAMKVDVRNEEEVRRLFASVKEMAGRIDICVNTAGFGASSSTPLSEMSMADYRVQVEVHNIGAFVFLRIALQTMLQQDLHVLPGSRQPTRGAIVLLTSLASEGAFIGVGNYTAAKFAVKGLVQTAAIENARKGVRINAVAPSYVSGGMMDTFLEQSPNLKQQILGDLAMGRLANPKEVSEAVLFLASSMSSYINGHTLVLDGGSSLQLANTLFT
ncbi:hypothetical protein BDV95DRAFT_559512 [Massariosphaeria phaeospora]|uniref:Uncharacterized protein n=1 Tax=Massariosphaeria phaeospora TaxID=100035 RepID=A0A7C8MN63_9PLEO|nr:hypothetical protein BDV95DRAFT_559512 [Massariosphaeria phaeospora]